VAKSRLSIVEIVRRVKSRDILIREFYVGNTIGKTWWSAGSSVFKCISITNTNFGKIKVTRFECGVTEDVDCTFRVSASDQI